MKKSILFALCAILTACSSQNSNSPTPPASEAPQSIIRTAKLNELDSYSDQTVAALSQAAASATSRNKDLIAQVSALDYDGLSLAPKDAVSTLDAKHQACLSLENKFLNGEVSEYLQWFKQYDFKAETICQKKSYPAIYSTKDGLLLGAVNLDFFDDAACVQAVGRSLPRVLRMQNLILSVAAENGVGFSIEKAIENKSDGDLYAIKVAVVAGQTVQTAVYSTGPLFKLARWFRTEFESGFDGYLAKSTDGLLIDAGRTDDLKAFLLSEQAHGNTVLQAIPADHADERNVVTTQLSQIKSLLDYLTTASQPAKPPVPLALENP